jgi:2-polyprenyl-6-methoxyphenol hydroxylase-like FAD-dependent oxidoreductase
MSHLRRHAVVLGASMSGLLNAAVLACHFEQVTLVERDQFDDQVVVRKGARRVGMSTAFGIEACRLSSNCSPAHARNSWTPA